ncbi:hypothetical protein KIW84_030699 [Lathyrus oleraceus]|uniref:Uncharacterized protein n=1 Tax=Pisum sativum TaxID=3888 RepID=A0A9D5AWK2_PEA|nr:hypothetical protein KIW84_030699 [Pisum sativum]
MALRTLRIQQVVLAKCSVFKPAMCDSFVSVLGCFSVLDENEHFRKGQLFKKNRMENIHSFIHSFILCKRKTEFILALPFAFQNDDEELNPILSRLKKNTKKKETSRREEASTSSLVQIEEVVVKACEGNMEDDTPTEMSANSPRRNAQFARGGRNTEMKTGILQLLYANPFTGMDHEDPYTH